MDSPQENVNSGGDFLAFSTEDSADNDRPFRNNFQHQSGGRYRKRSHNFRGFYSRGNRNFGDPSQFAPFDGHNPGGGRPYRGHDRPNFQNRNNNQRNFVPRHHHTERNQKFDAPIEQYFHQSMLEDPWASCYRFNCATESNEQEDQTTSQTDDKNDESEPVE